MTKLRLIISAILLSLVFIAFAAYQSADVLKKASEAQHLLVTLDETQPYLAKWAAHGSKNYTMTIESGWLPAAPRDRVLVFHDDIYVEQHRDSACPFSPANLCDAPLDEPDYYSIPKLFKNAYQCIRDTKAAYQKVSTSQEDFHGFDSADKLIKFGQSNWQTLGSSTLCAVEYDPVYGYPNAISYYIVGSLDGFGGFSITKLTLDP